MCQFKGLVRFATQKYSNKKGSAGNRFMHLTNYSINKKSDDFVANDDANSTSGHKWGMTALWKYVGAAPRGMLHADAGVAPWRCRGSCFIY